MSDLGWEGRVGSQEQFSRLSPESVLRTCPVILRLMVQGINLGLAAHKSIALAPFSYTYREHILKQRHMTA